MLYWCSPCQRFVNIQGSWWVKMLHRQSTNNCWIVCNFVSIFTQHRTQFNPLVYVLYIIIVARHDMHAGRCAAHHACDTFEKSCCTSRGGQQQQQQQQQQHPQNLDSFPALIADGETPMQVPAGTPQPAVRVHTKQNNWEAHRHHHQTWWTII